jgi:hypothetical protein
MCACGTVGNKQWYGNMKELVFSESDVLAVRPAFTPDNTGLVLSSP